MVGWCYPYVHPILFDLRLCTTTQNVAQTCTLLTANTPQAVGDLYRFATRADPAKVESRKDIVTTVDIAAKMREAALKSVIFIGVPRVSMSALEYLQHSLSYACQTILSLAAMTEAFEDDVKGTLRTQSHRFMHWSAVLSVVYLTCIQPSPSALPEQPIQLISRA